MSAGAAFGNRWLGPPIHRLLRADVSGTEHVPARGGLLVAANHLSFLDHFLLFSVSPRPLLFVGKSELTRGIGGRINLAFGMIPVDRGRGDLEALNPVAEVLSAGRAVAIFPEGTRSPSGELFRFRSGLARLSAMAQVPVVPVGLVGTDVVWPRGEHPALSRPAPGVLQVRFGPALTPPEPDARARREFTETLHDAVAKLSGQGRADRFAPI
jgi:1-acyl-sn-glycerol-3-phosphate acyltransferase